MPAKAAPKKPAPKKDKVPPVAPPPTYGQAGMKDPPRKQKPKGEPGPIRRAIKFLKDAKKGKV